MQYLAWYLVYGRLCVEVMAHRIGQPLTPLAPRQGTATRHSPAHAALVAMLAPSADPDPIRRYERATAERVARYLARADLLGPELEAEDLDEAGAILGRRPASWSEGDARLEAFVQSAGPEHDGRLVHYFHRHILRHETLLEGALRELEGAVIEMLGAPAGG